MESSQSKYITDLAAIVEAADRIKDFIHFTPILTSRTLNELSGRNLYFKSEFLQKTGSFKARGALNAILSSDSMAFVTHSSGNHGQAIAWAATKKGAIGHIVMPENSSHCKIDAVQNYGGIITFCEPTLIARETTAEKVVENTNATFIHAYENKYVISGQGTVGLELLQQVSELDALVIPLGGGGLCSGITIAVKSLNPNIIVIAAEPAEANDGYLSKQKGERVENVGTPVTIADGLRTNLGVNTWPIIRDLVDEIITVTEEEIRSALRLVLERMNVVIEPSSAVGVAVVLGSHFKEKYTNLKNVGVVLCGGMIVDVNESVAVLLS